MSPVLRWRLVLDLAAAGLFLFAFAYFWQGNLAHELAGAGMLLLLVVHNLFHRRWYAALAGPRRARRDRFNIAVTLVLGGGMLALLATSLLISETVFAALRLDDDFTARQIHAGIAYWLLVVVAAHLGLRWPLLMAVARQMAGIQRPNALRTTVLRLAAMGIAWQGWFSADALNLRARLLFQMSLDWWNFEESVAGFFVHCLAVGGLCACATYYAMQGLQRLRRSGAAGSLGRRGQGHDG